MLRHVLRATRKATITPALPLNQSVRGLTGLTVGVPKETTPEEGRVALTPVHVAKLKKAGASIRIETGAGVLSGFSDGLYKDAGADIVSTSEVTSSLAFFPTPHFIFF